MSKSNDFVNFEQVSLTFDYFDARGQKIDHNIHEIQKIT